MPMKPIFDTIFMDEVIFTNHARLQMQQRHITEKAVRECLRIPDKTIIQNSLRFRAIRKIKRFKKAYLIVVVFDKFTNRKEVVTVFYTSKFHKYL